MKGLSFIAVPGDVTKPWFEGSDAGSRLMHMLVSFLSLLILDPMIADGVTKAGELAASVDTSKAQYSMTASSGSFSSAGDSGRSP